MHRFLSQALAITVLSCHSIQAEDSLTPYTADTVPDNVIDLWNDIDFRADELETEVIKEWIEDGIVTRYVIFKIGTFKGADARLAALYTFPEGMEDGPAIVWSHGGGQRAERERGDYFARHGFATIDINWGGREIIEGIEANTDWGNVDPSQGPRFYPGALRQGTKLNLEPDEHTIDPVVSPRNGNWFLLTYAARRAITFLEEQPEVNPEQIGFTGYSMGGTITSMAAIDPRLAAVAPMVGGSGFINEDFPGIPDSSRARQYRNVDLFNSTIDSSAYWPHVTCPVLFLSATNDFHSTFENIYKSMAILPHNNWRASQLMHYSHSLGPEQWILLKLWFDRYLKGANVEIAKTPSSELKIEKTEGKATFTVTPVDGAKSVEIYYSHDPNPRARFWKLAESSEMDGTWTANLELRIGLPLFVFANCEYALDEAQEAFQGRASSYTITSEEQVWIPETIEVETLHAEAKPQSVLARFPEDFTDWGTSAQGNLRTFLFQDPERATPSSDDALKLTINPHRTPQSYRLRIEKNFWLTGVNEPKESYSFTRNITETGEQELLVKLSDFKDSDGNPMPDWDKIYTFSFSVYDGTTKSNIDFLDPANHQICSLMEWVNTE